MKKVKSSKNISQEEIESDPDHFTVFSLKPGWEKEMADVWSSDIIQEFKERQELLSTIPLEIRERTKTDKSYREDPRFCPYLTSLNMFVQILLPDAL